MKKLLKASLAGVMSLSLVACGGSDSDASKGSDADKSASDMKVAMITDYGDITDQSFNQTTYESAKAWSEKNGVEFNYYKPASDSDADRESSIEKAIEEGYNVIVMPGYAFAKSVVDEAGTYPDTKFVALDVSQFDLDSASGETDWQSDNVFCAVYQEEIAGYMAGVAAVKLGYKKLGFLGGMAVPAVIRYGYGFVQGANAAAEEMGVKDLEIKYAYGNQFFGDADITARMDTWYGGGTELVFACGGAIYTSAAEAAVKTNGKVIGVDVDQAPTIDGKYGEGLTVTSAMKGLSATVETLLTAIHDGKWDEYSGKLMNLGLVSENPEENYVQLPSSTQFGDNFTEDDYKALVADIYNGKIKIDNAVDTDMSTVAHVEFEGNIK